MNKLSQRCKEHLKNNGYTTYSLSKISGLERTTLHRLLTGSRIPSYEFLQKFSSSLRMNQNEKEELFELLEEIKAGYPVYENRKYIKNMIANINESDLFHSEFLFKPFIEKYISLIPSTTRYQQTLNQIIAFLEDFFYSCTDSSTIITNLPSDHAVFFNTLKTLFRHYDKTVNFYHIISFFKNPHTQSNVNCNLKTLYYVLPLALSDFNKYLPYYTYNTVAKPDFTQSLWPYYIITPTSTLMISDDYNYSILHQNSDQVTIDNKVAKSLLQKSVPLLTIYSPKDAFPIYLNNLNYSIFSYCLESAPCLLSYIPENFFLRTQQKYPEISILQKLKVKDFKNLKPSSSFFFTYEGLMHFWNTGEIKGQITSYFSPFTKDTRKEMLSDFLIDNKNKAQQSRMLKKHDTIPQSLHIELFLDNKQILFYMLDDLSHVRFITINESSIFEAFLDYFKTLEKEYNSYTLEETNTILENLLKS